MHGSERPTRRSETGARDRARPAHDRDYLILSDVHLGSDLVAHVRPWARDSWLSAAPEIDGRIASLLAHYTERARRNARELCLIIAGDFLDLVGVSLSADARATRTRLTREERRHGLGSAHDHVVQKVEAIAARHEGAFAALHAFVASGHQLVLVRGNHDVELHWRAAQRAFVSAISRPARDAGQRAEIERRITICPWFFAVEGLLYVEHGHEFDAMCSYGDPLLPTCPRDSRRIRHSPFAVMLRFVARPTRGLSSRSYENVGLPAYLRLLLDLGLCGSVGISVRFARAVSSLLGECHARARGDGGLRRLRAGLSRERFARRTQVSIATLRELTRLYARPAACSLPFMLRSLYLDRVLAIAAAFSCVLVAAYLDAAGGAVGGVVCFVLAALALSAFACFSPSRNLTPALRMRRGAAAIARLFDARYVIMGHTHEAEVRSLGRATYVNVGHWGEDDVPEERPENVPTPCTYLWLAADTGHRAELLRWDAVLGPRPSCEPAAPAPEPHTQVVTC